MVQAVELLGSRPSWTKSEVHCPSDAAGPPEPASWHLCQLAHAAAVLWTAACYAAKAKTHSHCTSSYNQARHGTKYRLKCYKHHINAMAWPEITLSVHGTAQHSKAQHSSAWHGTAQHGTAQRGTAQHSTAWHSAARHSAAQHSTAQHSTARHSTAQHSMAQRSTAQRSAAQHSTAQHSTAQHSTAQHSTAQHSTAQHSTLAHHAGPSDCSCQWPFGRGEVSRPQSCLPGCQAVT